MNLRQAHELQNLSGKFFSMDVLLLGNRIWVRSYLPVTALLFITQYFISTAAQSFLNLIMLPVQFFLVQKAAEHVATRRFDLKVLDSCWWSVSWRAGLYTIAIGLVVAIAIVAVILPLFGDTDIGSLTAEEISQRDPLNTGGDSIVLLILFYVIASFLAVGYATLRAFRVSCIKTRQCPQHVGIEQVLEEEEQERREVARPQAEPQSVAAVPAPSGVSRYQPPPRHSFRTKPQQIDEANRFMHQPAQTEKAASEDLSRYMPPADSQKEEGVSAEPDSPAQPTDLVGAAPGSAKWSGSSPEESPADSADEAEKDGNRGDSEP